MLHLALLALCCMHLTLLALCCISITNIMWHLALWYDIMIGIGGRGVEVELMAYWVRRH